MGGLKHIYSGHLVNPTPPMKFVTFLQFELNKFLPKHMGTGYLVNAIPPTILPESLLNFAAVFCQGPKMCMWLDVTWIFCYNNENNISDYYFLPQ